MFTQDFYNFNIDKDFSNTKRSKIIIKDFLERIEESQRVLKYSLYLPPTVSNTHITSEDMCLSSFSKLLDNTFNDIMNNCQFLLSTSNVNIFGYRNNNCNDLSLLTDCPNFWNHIFKQDVILSTYNKLRKLIGECYFASFYEHLQFTNYTNFEISSEYFDKCRHGLDFLLGFDPSHKNSKQYLEFIFNKDHSGFSFNKQYETYNAPYKYAVNASNSKRRIENILKKLDNFNINALYLYPPTEKPISSGITLNVLEFFDFIVCRRDKLSDIDNNILAIINSHKEGAAFSKSNYKLYLECVNHLLSSISIDVLDKNVFPDKDTSSDKDVSSDNTLNTSHKLSLSDKIYLRYQLEKVFAPSTIDCMYQNIAKTSGTNYALDDQATINLLSTCLTLPNVFTRHYIFQIAADTLIKHHDYDFSDSYFFTKYMEDPTQLVTMARSKTNHLRQHYKVSQWLDRYYDFINYLGQLFFPICEDYFFCSLWNSIKQIFKDSTDANCIVILYTLLSYYLNDEKLVEHLFSIEDSILSPTYDRTISPEHIIHPVFVYNPDTKINYNLYKKCLMSLNLIKEKNTPDFINSDYLASLTKESAKHIQSYYIRGLLE